MPYSSKDQCCLCAHNTTDLITKSSQKLELVQGLLKLEGLPQPNSTAGDNVCLFCHDDLENIHHFLRRIATRQQQEQQNLTIPKTTVSMHQNDPQQQYCDQGMSLGQYVLPQESLSSVSTGVKQSTHLEKQVILRDKTTAGSMHWNDQKQQYYDQGMSLGQYVLLPEQSLTSASTDVKRRTDLEKQVIPRDKTADSMHWNDLKQQFFGQGLQQQHQQFVTLPSIGVKQRTDLEKKFIPKANCKEISEKSMPAKRLRRPPKRYVDDESFCDLLTPKHVTFVKHPQKIPKFKLNNFPIVAYIRSSAGSIIGDLFEVHHNGKQSRIRILCRQCSEVFTMETNFREHTATHRREDNEKTNLDKPSENFSYLCRICEKSFQAHYAVRRHFKSSHNDERPFKCDRCSATFKYAVNLNYHLARHMDKKPYQCPLCDRKFSLRYELSVHLRIHTGVKPFKCLLCPKAFAHRSNLVVHRLSHNQQSLLKFNCGQCKASFGNRFYLKRHKRRVHKRKAKTTADTNNLQEFNQGDISNNLEANTCEVYEKSTKAATEIDIGVPTSFNNAPGNISSQPQASLSHITILPNSFKIIENPEVKKILDFKQHLAPGNLTDIMKAEEENFVTTHNQGLLHKRSSNYSKNASINTNATNSLVKGDKQSSEVAISYKISDRRVPNDKISSISQRAINTQKIGKTIMKLNNDPSVLQTAKLFKILPIHENVSNLKPGQPEGFSNSSTYKGNTTIDSHTANSSSKKTCTQDSSNRYKGVNNENSTVNTPRLGPINTELKTLDNFQPTHVANMDSSNSPGQAAINVNFEISTKTSLNNKVTTKDVRNSPSRTNPAPNLTLVPSQSLLKTNISTKTSSSLKTPLKLQLSPHSLLKPHKEIPPSPSKPRITKVEILPPVNLQSMQTSLPKEPLTSTPPVMVKIPTEYKFQCSKCWKYFKQKSALNKHERTHTGQKPYKCNLCPKAYADASNYKKHKLLHTKAADAMNIPRPKRPASPALSTVSDPDPDGIEAMQTIQRFEFSSGDEDEMESYLWQDALQHSLMNEEIRENIKRNLMAINSAIMPAEETGESFKGKTIFSSNYYSSENPD